MDAPHGPTTQHPIRALLVEDDTEYAEVIRALLGLPDRAAALVAVCRTLDEARMWAGTNAADVILLDLHLPGSAGLDTFHAIRDYFPETPVLVLSGLDDQDLAVQTVRLGAQDYLPKAGLDRPVLLRALRYAIERGRVEAELERQNQMFVTLLDHVPDRIYFKDLASRFIKANRAMALVAGFSDPEQMVGLTDFDIFAGEHAEEGYADERRILETGEPIEGKIEKETLPDGREDWLLTTKMPFRDRAGRLVGTFGISRVITEIKSMERALDAERTLLRSVIDHLPDPIFLLGPDGVFRLSNTAHAKFLGAAPGDVVGRPASAWFANDSVRALHRRDAEIFRTGQPALDREVQAEDASGRPVWFLSSRIPLRDGKGDALGVVGIQRDITHQKLAETGLIQSNADLFAALADLKNASAELRSLQMQLIEAEKMKVVGRLAAGVAHEVKNPLAIVQLGLEYLAQEKYPKKSGIPAVLREIGDAIKRADTVVKGLLDFSAQRRFEPGEENLNTIFDRALTLTRGEFKNAHIEIVREFEPALPKIAVDRLKMSQVLVNLLINAAHAMGPSGGVLTVRTGIRHAPSPSRAGDAGGPFAPGERVVFAEVLDTGPGIPEADLPRIFDPFFSTKPTGKGTGLGLTVCRSIVELHGGTLTAENRPMRGARFCVMLPLVQPSPQTQTGTTPCLSVNRTAASSSWTTSRGSPTSSA